MLLRYFGFHQDPFGATPDPQFLYHSHTHREALASLQYGFYSNRGFTALIAPPGMGKTTLLFHFLDHIRDSARTVFLFQTQCGPQELMRYILRDLGIAPSQDIVEMHHQLNEVLLTEARAGRKFVLVIDEAQNLSDDALETVRLLTNFETPRAKLMQIVLAGQPQLADKLMTPQLEQLRQRISTICRIESLSKEETTAYISQRLNLAGYSGAALFTEEALKLITEASQGVPRTINNLCFNALSLCCALKRKQVDADAAAEVIADQHLIRHSEEIFAVAREIAVGQPSKPKQRKQADWLAKLFIPGVAALLVISVLGVLWAARSYKARYARSVEVTALPSPVVAPSSPNTRRIGVVEPSPESAQLEITVAPHQTLREIEIRYLGGVNSENLQKLQMLNPSLINPNLIRPGQKIRIPTPVAPQAKNETPETQIKNLP